MVKELKLAYEFDFVFDGQKVFRKLLHALANPGTIGSIGHQAGKFAGSHQALMALGCTLLDNEETMYVEKNPVLSADLHSLKNIKHGTYADPQQSATVFLQCTELAGRESMTLEGPGIKDRLTVEVYPYIKKVTALRQSLQIEYPLGVDLVFADVTGNIMGLPRLCRMI